MSLRGEKMKAIEKEIVRLTMERDALTHRIEGLRYAVQLMSGEELQVPDQKTRARRGNVKNTVLDVVGQAGSRGASVAEVLEYAKRDFQVDLDRGSVSSLLSRLKSANTLVFDGERYSVKQLGVVHTLTAA